MSRITTVPATKIPAPALRMPQSMARMQGRHLYPCDPHQPVRGPGLLSRCPCRSLLSPFFQKQSGSPTIRSWNHLTAQRIETGTPEGDALGFTEELFSGWLELETGNRLILHYIISRHRNEGNTQALICHWLMLGYNVDVVMPRPIMQHILKKFRFIATRMRFPDQYEGVVEVWYRHRSGGIRMSGQLTDRVVCKDSLTDLPGRYDALLHYAL